MVSRIGVVFVTAGLVWVVLTWTLTIEQLVVGAAVAVGVTAALALLDRRGRSWTVSGWRAAALLVRLAASSAHHIVLANVRLAARVWRPERPLRSGMVVVPTAMRTPSGVTAVGVLTSLAVESQIVDVDLRRHTMQYHTVDVPKGTPTPTDSINGWAERLLAPLERR